MPSFACLKNLGSFRQFYLTYPRISQTLSGELSITPQRLIERPTFSHFLELFKVENPFKPQFCNESKMISWGSSSSKRWGARAHCFN
jgi:hypothetical protein